MQLSVTSFYAKLSLHNIFMQNSLLILLRPSMGPMISFNAVAFKF